MALLDGIKKFFGETPNNQEPKAPNFYLVNGASGTKISNGRLMEEYNRLFQGVQKYETFDEMYRSDDKCAMAINVIEAPILSTDFYVKGYIDKETKIVSDKDKKIADFVEDCLFKRMKRPDRNQFMYECLKMVRDGVSVFEIILKQDKQGIIIDKLAVRLPRTIYKRETSDGAFGITQNAPYQGGMKEIPGWKLLVFTFGKEGENYEGISLLRHAGKSWIAKKALEEYELIGYENQFKGVRKVRVPQGLTQEEKDTYLKNVVDFQVGNDNTIVFPGNKNEIDFEFANMDIPQAQHIRQTIKDKGAEIQDLMLATFLKLGSSEKGSYGMAKQGENLFLSSIEFIVKQICGVINSTLIPLLVDFNFGKQENYPELSYGTIGDVDRKALSEVFGVLSNARLLTPDTNTEQRFRDQLGLPEKEENAEPTTVPTEPTPGSVEAHEHHNHSNPFYECVYPLNIVKMTEKISNPKKLQEPKRYSEFNSYRPLTFVEEGVNRQRYEEKLTSLESGFSSEFKKLADQQKEAIIKQVKEALDNNDFAQLASIKTTSKELTNLIAEVRKQSFEFGKNTAAEELGVATPATNASQKAYLTMEAKSMADKVVDDMGATAESVVAQQIGKASGKIENVLALEVLNEVRGQLEKQIDNALNYVNTLSVSGTVNTGLGSTREAYADMIYGFQYSAIIDGHTTDRCLSLDGRTVKAGSAEYYLYSPPQHYNCRSRWVAITYDTTYKPRIGSIPKSIPATTDINNSQDLIRPYIQKGSPAIQILQDEVREREEKNKQYETEGKYQNRIDANNKRINQINKALKGKT